MFIRRNYAENWVSKTLTYCMFLKEMRSWNVLCKAYSLLMLESSGRMKIWTILCGCWSWSRRRCGFRRDHAFSTLSMWKSLHVVQESTTFAGVVANNFHAFVSFYSTNEMCMKILGFVAFAVRNSLVKVILTGTCWSHVRESVKKQCAAFVLAAWQLFYSFSTAFLQLFYSFSTAFLQLFHSFFTAFLQLFHRTKWKRLMWIRYRESRLFLVSLNFGAHFGSKIK